MQGLGWARRQDRFFRQTEQSSSVASSKSSNPLAIAAGIVLAAAAAMAGIYFYLDAHSPSVPSQAAAPAKTSASVGEAPGAPVPVTEFSLPGIDGKTHTFEEWRGKVVILNFWATWCPPCRREIPEFVKLQTEYGDRGLQFIGIALDREDLVKQYAAEEKLNYPQLFGQNEIFELGQALGNSMGALPFTVIVDRQGLIHRRIFGELAREEAIAIFEPLLEG